MGCCLIDAYDNSAEMSLMTYTPFIKWFQFKTNISSQGLCTGCCHCLEFPSLPLVCKAPLKKFLNVFLVVLGLCCCSQAFSGCSKQGLLSGYGAQASLVAVSGLLFIAVVSLVAEHRL